MKYICWHCGKELENSKEIMSRVYCAECNTDIEKFRKERLNEYLTLKYKIMFDRALRYMEDSCKGYMYEYQRASKIILEQALGNYNTFQSSHEMIAAIILTEYNVDYEVQKQIGKHRVDFHIPDMNVVLEIDGYMHEHREIEDNQRDIDIRRDLGSEWEVVRIGTKYIEENPFALVEAIESLYKYRQSIRGKHNGILPEWYSKREKKHYKEITSSKKTF